MAVVSLQATVGDGSHNPHPRCRVIANRVPPTFPDQRDAGIRADCQSFGNGVRETIKHSRSFTSEKCFEENIGKFFIGEGGHLLTVLKSEALGFRRHTPLSSLCLLDLLHLTEHRKPNTQITN